MRVLNRQSELYQHLYNDALMRLARVPGLSGLKPIKGLDFLSWPGEVIGYIFNRDELELPSPSKFGNHPNMGDYLTERTRDAMTRSFGANTRSTVNVPMSIAWPAAILSVISEERRSIGSARDYIDIALVAHYSVMRYAYQITRVLNRGSSESRLKGERLTLDQAIMELVEGREPKITEPLAGMEKVLTVGLVGTNQLTWGMQSKYNSSEAVVSYLNGVSAEDWGKILEKMDPDNHYTMIFYVNGPWGANRLPLEGDMFLDSYGVDAIRTYFSKLVDEYYHTEESLTTEVALEIIRAYSAANDTSQPTTRIFRELNQLARDKWLELEVINPTELRAIAKSEFDEYFELIRAVRVVREYIVK